MFTPGSRACGYRTASGRAKWLNRDPIGEWGGLNLYGYVGNNPTKFSDPFGLWQWGWPPWGNKKDKDKKPEQPGPLDGACDVIKDKAPDVVKEVLKDRAEKEIGKRGAMPGSGKLGAIGAALGGLLDAALGLLDAGPGLTQNAAMAGPNLRLKSLDPTSDEFDRAFERQLEMAGRCQDVSKKLDK